jgi:hypothetical protein
MWLRQLAVAELVRFDILLAVKASILLFYVLTWCELAGKHKRFRKTHCPHLQG